MEQLDFNTEQYLIVLKERIERSLDYQDRIELETAHATIGAIVVHLKYNLMPDEEDMQEFRDYEQCIVEILANSL